MIKRYKRHLKVGGAGVVLLDFIPSSGFAWTYSIDPASRSGIEVISDQILLRPQLNPKAIGGYRMRRIVVTASHPATYLIRFCLSRPWEPDKIAEERVFTFVISGQLT